MKKILTVSLLFAFLNPLVFAQKDRQKTVVYKPDTSHFANPERGLCRAYPTFASDYKPLDINELAIARLSENITLIQRTWYLDAFRDKPISQDFLDIINTDFYVMREAGVKGVARFGYVDKQAAGAARPPFGDVPKSRVLEHIAQLKPILQKNADVITFVEMGFIGICGDGIFSDHFGVADTGRLAPQHLRERREVLDALLAAVPATRMLAVRTPALKTGMFNLRTADSLRQSYAFSGKPLARVGHHATVFSTEKNTAENAYLAAETRFLPMGGELGAGTADCEKLDERLRQFHWTYLNLDDKSSLKNSTCGAEIAKKLGYRLRLTEAKFDPSVRAGSVFHLTLNIENEGFAPVLNPRVMQLVWRKQGKNQTVFRTNLHFGQDVRTLLPGPGETRKLTLSGLAPQLTGSYDLFLELPAPPREDKISGKPEYSIRLANARMWDVKKGWNDLKMTVQVRRSDR